MIKLKLYEQSHYLLMFNLFLWHWIHNYTHLLSNFKVVHPNIEFIVIVSITIIISFAVNTFINIFSSKNCFELLLKQQRPKVDKWVLYFIIHIHIFFLVLFGIFYRFYLVNDLLIIEILSSVYEWFHQSFLMREFFESWIFNFSVELYRAWTIEKWVEVLKAFIFDIV